MEAAAATSMRASATSVRASASSAATVAAAMTGKSKLRRTGKCDRRGDSKECL
jgi:hypothetical protein